LDGQVASRGIKRGWNSQKDVLILKLILERVFWVRVLWAIVRYGSIPGLPDMQEVLG
jgi:hypothetical protein